MEEKNHKLIVVIVNKGDASKVVKGAKKEGAVGATVLTGRGSSIRDKAKLFGLPIEPEKEMIFIIVLEEQVEIILKKITTLVDLNAPGKGIAFVLEVEKVVGIL
ncbi:MAG: P-II family nitrogen regulator [Bacilli bacterium]|jgi:nitrogen regulatory protein PII